jgi:hypothetical protein
MSDGPLSSLVNPVVPTNVDLFEDLCEALRRKDLGKGETALALLKKLLSEQVDLPRESSVKSGTHDTGSLPVREA